MKKPSIKLMKQRIAKYKKECDSQLPTLVGLYRRLGLDRKNWGRDIDKLFDRTTTSGRKKAQVMRAVINDAADWVEEKLLATAFEADRTAVMKYWSVAFQTRYIGEATIIPPINIQLASPAETTPVTTIIGDKRTSDGEVARGTH